MTFDTYTDCGKYFNVSKDTISNRIAKGKVYDFKYQFRDHTTDKWSPIDQSVIKHARKVNSSLFLHTRRARQLRAMHPVQIRQLFTGEIKTFESLSSLAEFLEVKNGTITRWITEQKQPVVRGYYQIKLLSDTSPWENVDPYFALMKTTGRVPVEVENICTKERTVYQSVVDAARSLGCKDYMMYVYAASNGKRIYNGNRIGFYPLTVHS